MLRNRVGDYRMDQMQEEERTNGEEGSEDKAEHQEAVHHLVMKENPLVNTQALNSTPPSTFPSINSAQRYEVTSGTINIHSQQEVSDPYNNAEAVGNPVPEGYLGDSDAISSYSLSEAWETDFETNSEYVAEWQYQYDASPGDYAGLSSSSLSGANARNLELESDSDSETDDHEPEPTGPPPYQQPPAYSSWRQANPPEYSYADYRGGRNYIEARDEKRYRAIMARDMLFWRPDREKMKMISAARSEPWVSYLRVEAERDEEDAELTMKLYECSSNVLRLSPCWFPK